MTVAGRQRFTRAHPCPICDGWDQVARGQNRRCYGFLSDDGKWAHCTREELAGGLDREESDTYAHHLERDCRCGQQHGAAASKVATSRRAARARRIAAVYDYENLAGGLAYQVVRHEPKAFRQRRPDGAGGWTWDLKGIDRILYRLPQLASADPAAWVFVLEGEKDVDRAVTAGLVATCNSEGAGKWPASGTAALAGRSVALLPDQDVKGREHAEKVQRALLPVVSELRTINLVGAKDLTEWLDRGHTAAELMMLVEAVAPPPPESGAELLDAVAAHYIRFVRFPGPLDLVAATLWTVHTHAVAAFDTTPYLRLQSPEKASGKTRFLEVAATLVARPEPWLNASPAALFRLVEEECPTLLMDEVDAIFGPKAKENEDLRALLNAGHRRGAVVARMVGEGTKMEVKRFRVFCPKALVGLGELPDTVRSRSIVIHMKRRSRGERVERFRIRSSERIGFELRDRLAAWTAAHLRRLREAEPDVPDALGDRFADCWEPLLAIADLAGGTWAPRARQAALALSGSDPDQDGSRGVRLLADVRVVFSTLGQDRIPSAVLADKLSALEESPWGDLDGRGKKLDSRSLAYRLKPLDVRPSVIRIGDTTARGYLMTDFEEAWLRYLAPIDRTISTTVTEDVAAGSGEPDLSSNNGLQPGLKAVTDDLFGAPDESAASGSNRVQNGAGYVVTPKTGEGEGAQGPDGADMEDDEERDRYLAGLVAVESEGGPL